MGQPNKRSSRGVFLQGSHPKENSVAWHFAISF
jgi:hypothetical protein